MFMDVITRHPEQKRNRVDADNSAKLILIKDLYKVVDKHQRSLKLAGLICS